MTGGGGYRLREKVQAENIAKKAASVISALVVHVGESHPLATSEFFKYMVPSKGRRLGQPLIQASTNTDLFNRPLSNNPNINLFLNRT